MLTKIKKILYKKVKPVVGYSILGVMLFLTALLGYDAYNSDLLFFNPNPVTEPTVYPLSPKEYKQALLEQKPIETLSMGTHNGKPNFKDNIKKYDGLFKEAAKKYKVDCTLIKATMLAESRGNAKIRSGVGAVGLMQLMPATARAMGYGGNLTDPRVNIMAGTKYMAHLKERGCHEKPANEVCDVKKDVKYRLAAYNGGPKCNQPGNGKCSRQTAWECIYYDAYGQTRHYVNRVKANYEELKNKGWGC